MWEAKFAKPESIQKYKTRPKMKAMHPKMQRIGKLEKLGKVSENTKQQVTNKIECAKYPDNKKVPRMQKPHIIEVAKNSTRK